jgi:DNA-binding XRE family transcriptional regulator
MVVETNFKRWRRQCGFTQERAARELDLSKSRIEHYDKGVSRSSKLPAAPSYAERITMAVIAQKVRLAPWPE